MSDALRSPSSLDAERILVVAPHQDDESLGCGGLLHELALAGRQIEVVFVTDGGASHPRSRLWPRERLAAQREREAEEAMALVGLSKAPRHFMRLRDADMPRPGSAEDDAALAAACAISDAFRPDLALLPWRRDPHRDHRDAWSLFTRAFAALGRLPEVLEYAIWLDEIGVPDDHPRAGEAERVRFDVASGLDAKLAAVKAHSSQVSDLIPDDPTAFRLTDQTIRRLVGPVESYWRPLS